MKCWEVNELLVAYLDGEVSPSERTLIQAHLAGCDVCRKEMAALSATQSRVNRSLQALAAQATPSPQAWSRLQARLAGEAHVPSWLQRLALDIGHSLKMRYKLALAAVVLVAVIAVAFVAYPPTRTWAQGVLAQFGGLIITDAPTWPEILLRATPAPTPIGQPTATPMLTPVPIMTVEEASNVAGFQVLSPRYVPTGYRLFGRGADQEEAGTFVSTVYATASEKRISIHQIRYVPGLPGLVEFPVGDAPTTDVTVREQPGLWVERAKLGVRSDTRTGGTEIWPLNVLMWEEGNTLFSLYADELPLEEMLRIAESLAP